MLCRRHAPCGDGRGLRRNRRRLPRHHRPSGPPRWRPLVTALPAVARQAVPCRLLHGEPHPGLVRFVRHPAPAHRLPPPEAPGSRLVAPRQAAQAEEQAPPPSGPPSSPCALGDGRPPPGQGQAERWARSVSVRPRGVVRPPSPAGPRGGPLGAHLPALGAAAAREAEDQVACIAQNHRLDPPLSRPERSAASLLSVGVLAHHRRR